MAFYCLQDYQVKLQGWLKNKSDGILLSMIMLIIGIITSDSGFEIAVVLVLIALIGWRYIITNVDNVHDPCIVQIKL